MPLEQGDNKAAIAHNIKTEEAAGKPHDQAVAIALSTAKDGDDMVPAAGIVFITPENRVLLLQRPNGEWGLPGGRIEAGETPDEAARRETLEETGYAPLMALRVLGLFENFRGYTSICPQFPVCLNDEHQGFGWFDIVALPGPLHRTTKTLIDLALANNAAMDERERDINGWLEIDDNPIMAVGVFPYLGKRIKGAPDPDKFYMVYRPAEEVRDPECMDSFRLLPWIDDHLMLGQGDSLTPPEAKPIEGVIGERIYFDPDAGFGQMKANIKVWTQTHEGRVEAGKRQLSLGYRCRFDYEPGEFNGIKYDYVQRMMRGNHLASVNDGRSGPEIAVAMDAKDFSFVTDSKEYEIMPTVKTPVVTKAPKIKKVSNVIRGLMQFVKDEMDKPDAEKSTDSGELKQLGELLEQVSPVVEKIAALGVVASGQAESDVDEGQDIVLDEEDDEETKRKKEAAAGKPKKPEGEAMDSSDIKAFIAAQVKAGIAAATKDLQPVTDARDVLASIRRGAAMAERASHFIGNFQTAMDGKDGTEQEVAEYIVKTAGIPGVAKGQEIGAVNAWMHGRTPPTQRTLSMPGAHAMDGADATKVPAFAQKYEQRTK